MKYNTRIHLFGALALIAAVTACNAPAPSAPVQKDGAVGNARMFIYRDAKTGCDYIVVATDSFRGGTAITPRMWSDGEQVCWEDITMDRSHSRRRG